MKENIVRIGSHDKFFKEATVGRVSVITVEPDSARTFKRSLKKGNKKELLISKETIKEVDFTKVTAYTEKGALLRWNIPNDGDGYEIDRTERIEPIKSTPDFSSLYERNLQRIKTALDVGEMLGREFPNARIELEGPAKSVYKNGEIDKGIIDEGNMFGIVFKAHNTPTSKSS